MVGVKKREIMNIAKINSSVFDYSNSKFTQKKKMKFVMANIKIVQFYCILNCMWTDG